MLALPHKVENLPGKGPQGPVTPSCQKHAEGHDAVLFHGEHQDLLLPMMGCGLQASGHQLPRSHCSIGEEWGPGTGADSEEWSNSGLRTSISPVCENTGSSSWQQGLRWQEKPQQTTPSVPLGHSLTGARPGHSYTVKSPSSFSSSEEADSSSFGGSLCLMRVR